MPLANQYMPVKNQVFWLLNGLGQQFEYFFTAMLKVPVPSYNAFILQCHELYITNLKVSKHVNHALAFVGWLSFKLQELTKGQVSIQF